ncbi:hypothetical protein ACOJQI_18840 [Bacillus salacetis]
MKSAREEGANRQESKIGTWISVGVVGLVILLTYFLLFGFYMDRV